MNLIPGETVTIRVANPIWYRRHAYANNVTINQYNTYTGTIVKEKWHKDTKIGITTGNPRFPVRVIELSDIEGFGTEKLPQSQTTKTWIVSGSKGNTYTVTESNGVKSCTCPGFVYRGNCKHTN